MITGQNALLNQYVPTFYIKNIRDGQGLIYDSVRRAYINADLNIAGGAERLGELLDVSPSVDNPLSLQNGQSLTYNSFTSLWENSFTDYNTLLNKPTSSSFSFAGLSDTAKPSLPDGYVKWNSAGTQLVYSTTIPAASITGLALVATTGDYNDLINKPPITGGTVTHVAVVTANGVSAIVANPSTTPAMLFTLGNITPTSVNATGTVLGSNLSGTNTGDQTITLTGDVSGSGNNSFATTLAIVNSTTGTYGDSVTVPQITVDGKGRITNVINVPISTTGVGTVTSVDVSGGTTGLTTSGGPVTSAGTITLGGTLSVANGGTGQVTASDAFNSLAPSQVGNAGMFLTTDGSLISWATIPAGSGTVTSVAASGSNGVVVTGSPITTSGTINIDLGDITPTSIVSIGMVTGSNLSGTNTGDQTITLTGDVTGSGTGSFPATLATVNVSPGMYGDSTNVPVVTVNNKGLVTSLSTQPIDVTVSDLLPADGSTTETFTIQTRHQYIVTGRLEIVGHVINNGRIAIL